jgi:hypothetical protein
MCPIALPLFCSLIVIAKVYMTQDIQKPKMPFSQDFLSIRRRGLFDGPIIVITDLIGEPHLHYQRQRQIIGQQWDMDSTKFDTSNNNTSTLLVVVEAKPEHLQASRNPNRHNHMGFKHFKTVVWDYVEGPSIHRVLYMDLDVIGGKPLKDFFDNYEESLSSRRRRPPHQKTTTTTTTLPSPLCHSLSVPNESDKNPENMSRIPV